MRETKGGILLHFWAGNVQWGGEYAGFSKMVDLERERVFLLSRIVGDSTVGFIRDKKESCSTWRGQHVGTGFGSFDKLHKGRGFILLDLHFI